MTFSKNTRNFFVPSFLLKLKTCLENIHEKVRLSLNLRVSDSIVLAFNFKLDFTLFV
jgi:hypothetical protein